MSTLNLKEALEEKEKEFHGKDDLFGMTLLTNAGYISSSRSIMFTSHLRQFVNLVNPDPPKVFTNYENIVGKYSTGYYQAKRELEVVDKIPKFEDGINDDHIYLLFVYDEKNDHYDIIEKKICENLTEKYGFTYKNTGIDKKEVGDIIEKGEVLYSSTSYDDDLNYMYGTNVKVMYAIDNDTIEDAIKVSESFAKRMISKEVEVVKVSLNDNDILCNIYGNNETYKAFPDIGEEIVDKIICAKRRIHNNQVLYDLKKSNLRKINFVNDALFYNSGKVVDINIYCNKPLEEIEDNIFNEQLRKYLILQKRYYSRIYERCEQILNSGSSYSNDISYYYKRSKEILDDDVKWREEASMFSHIVIEFLVERDSPLTIGQKITGRMGNKGVVSKIIPDDEMPYTDSGERVECILNALGVVNRLNSAQIFEISINFICSRVVDKIKTMKTLKEKEKLLFDIIKRFNPDQCKKLKEYYKELPLREKREFFQSVIDDGIYIHQHVFWEGEYIFDIIRKIYEDYDWIKPVEAYINKWGRKIKIMKPVIIGDLYMIKLKQSSKKGFSARSIGATSRKGVPEKSIRNKVHQDLYSSTPIRLGDQEDVNATIGVPPEVIAQLHMHYRSSIAGRRNLGKDLLNHMKKLKDFSEDDKVSNRNVEILQAYLKAMGYRVEFFGDELDIKIKTGYLDSHETEDGLMICTDEEYEDYELMQSIKRKYENKVCLVSTVDEYDEIIQKEFQRKKDEQEYYMIDINV